VIGGRHWLAHATWRSSSKHLSLTFDVTRLPVFALSGVSVGTVFRGSSALPLFLDKEEHVEGFGRHDFRHTCVGLVVRVDCADASGCVRGFPPIGDGSGGRGGAQIEREQGEAGCSESCVKTPRRGGWDGYVSEPAFWRDCLEGAFVE
jgi:hypothetical protein